MGRCWITVNALTTRPKPGNQPRDEPKPRVAEQARYARLFFRGYSLLHRFLHHNMRPGVWAKGAKMSAQQIFKALQDVEAQRALPQFETCLGNASAAQLFVAYLRDASRPLPLPQRRGGASAKRRVFH